MENKNVTWNDVENIFATDVIRQAKDRAKRWKTACLITAAALVLTNTVWFIRARKGEGKWIFLQ